MYFLLYVLSGIVGLASLVCWIITLIKMFRFAGILQGILGIICALYAFIWGWMRVQETDNRNVMLIWSALVLIGLVINIMMRALS